MKTHWMELLDQHTV